MQALDTSDFTNNFQMMVNAYSAAAGRRLEVRRQSLAEKAEADQVNLEQQRIDAQAQNDAVDRQLKQQRMAQESAEAARSQLQFDLQLPVFIKEMANTEMKLDMTRRDAIASKAATDLWTGGNATEAGAVRFRSANAPVAPATTATTTAPTAVKANTVVSSPAEKPYRAPVLTTKDPTGASLYFNRTTKTWDAQPPAGSLSRDAAEKIASENDDLVSRATK